MPDVFVAKPHHKKADDTQKPIEKLNTHTKSENKELLISEKDDNTHILTAYCKNPKGLAFKNQEEGENVLLFLRQHLITNIKWVTITTLLLIAPIIVLPIFNLLNFNAISFPLTYQIFFTLFYYLVVLSYAYVNFITWYFNISLVTNIRVIDIDFSGLIYKNIAITKLSLVQDVSANQVGVIPTFFDYGDVLVQTAGNNDNFDFLSCPHPENVVHIVQDLIGKRNGNI